MDELLKLIEWQRLYGYDKDIVLTSTLLIGLLDDVEPFTGKLKYKPIEIYGGYHETIMRYEYRHKGIFLKYQKTWDSSKYKYTDTFDCRLVIRDYIHNKGKYTTILKFVVPDEETAILYLSKLFNIKHIFNNRLVKIHYIPKVKDSCKLKEVNDFKHYKASYKKISAGDRGERVDDIHSKNRADELTKLRLLKLNPTDYYNFNFETKLVKRFSSWGSRSNYVRWSPWVYNWRTRELEYDLETYNKYKRK